MSIGQAPPTPSMQFQVDAYPGSDNNILGSAAVTAAFWNYYSTWATAYALYFGYQLEVTNYIYSPTAIERTITQPGEWEAWLSTLDVGAVQPAAGTTPPAPPAPPTPLPTPPAPPATTDWGLVALSGAAIVSVVGLFIFMLNQGGRATANPTIVWRPSAGGTGWTGNGSSGPLLICKQPHDKWAVWYWTTKYGPVNTLDEAKALAEFLNAHPHSFPRRSGKGVIYASPRRFYRTEREQPVTSYRVHMASGCAVVVSAASPESAMKRAVGKSSASVDDLPVHAELV